LIIRVSDIESITRFTYHLSGTYNLLCIWEIFAKFNRMYL